VKSAIDLCRLTNVSARTLQKLNLALIVIEFLYGIYLETPFLVFPLLTLFSFGLISVRHRLQDVLAALGLLALVLAPRYAQRYRGGILDDGLLNSMVGKFVQDDLLSGAQSLVTRAAALVIVFFLFRLIWKFRERPFLTFLVCFLAMLAAQFFIPSQANAVGFYFVLAVVAFFGKFFVSAIFFWRNNPSAPANVRNFVWIAPFWQNDLPTWDSRPLGAPEPLDLSEQQRIFGNLALMLGASILLSLLQTLCFDKNYLAIPYLPFVGFENPELRGITPAAGWINIVVPGVSFICRALWFPTNLIANFLRSLGYKTSFGVRNPLRATSVVDFYSRLYVFYNRALVEIVFIPIYPRLKKLIPNRTVRKTIALGISIFLFSLVYHVSRDGSALVGRGGAAEMGQFLGGNAVYSLLLALVICSSQLLIEVKFTLKWPSALRLTFYFLFYFLVLFFGTARRETLETKLHFIQFLFGFGR
jgi:hypothetical protein